MTLDELKTWVNARLRVYNEEIHSLYEEWDKIPNGEKTMEGFETLQKKLDPLKISRDELFMFRDKLNEVESQ